ncbi:MAG: hypothetical protein IPG88_27540 [Gemmatimonadetes bacterium]|nr:hypothetical protein [Gemmatimonadota bacterium]
MFKYTVIDKAGVSTPSYRRLEALLVKRQGKWRIVMERQLDAVTEAAGTPSRTRTGATPGARVTAGPVPSPRFI